MWHDLTIGKILNGTTILQDVNPEGASMKMKNTTENGVQNGGTSIMVDIQISQFVNLAYV